ncbi:hypothetical protein AMTR_s00009p00067950 [Amborella trichopoda]|uniref:Uncharacterized protein n=1 Tax=Amborella trichopoda TaxID=13333 RepID=W1NH66_AMBTC|nr:hypothetical protein AMTR_s00009p00067950 [Amborella trichopoda]
MPRPQWSARKITMVAFELAAEITVLTTHPIAQIRTPSSLEMLSIVNCTLVPPSPPSNLPSQPHSPPLLPLGHPAHPNHMTNPDAYLASPLSMFPRVKIAYFPQATLLPLSHLFKPKTSTTLSNQTTVNDRSPCTFLELDLKAAKDHFIDPPIYFPPPLYSAMPEKAGPSSSS